MNSRDPLANEIAASTAGASDVRTRVSPLWRIDPPGMTGWNANAEVGVPLVIADGEIRIKLVATTEGVSAFVLAGDYEHAVAVLAGLGFPRDRVKRMLCG